MVENANFYFIFILVKFEIEFSFLSDDNNYSLVQSKLLPVV